MNLLHRLPPRLLLLLLYNNWLLLLLNNNWLWLLNKNWLLLLLNNNWLRLLLLKQNLLSLQNLVRLLHDNLLSSLHHLLWLLHDKWLRLRLYLRLNKLGLLIIDHSILSIDCRDPIILLIRLFLFVYLCVRWFSVQVALVGLNVLFFNVCHFGIFNKFKLYK